MDQSDESLTKKQTKVRDLSSGRTGQGMDPARKKIQVNWAYLCCREVGGTLVPFGWEVKRLIVKSVCESWFCYA